MRPSLFVVASAALPAAVWAGWSPARQQPAAVKTVITEGVREQRSDASTFRARWSPIADMPPATVIAYRTITKQAEAPSKSRQVDGSPAVRSRRVALRLDLCQRHRMHKVYSDHGRRWRCRR